MERLRAVLLDVFDTVLTVDFDAALDGLVAASGLGRDDWAAGVSRYGNALMTGDMTSEDAFAATFELAGRVLPDTSALVRRDLELLLECATVYPDVVPAIRRIRQDGAKVALVSNCAANAGPLLESLGLADVVDAVILSCHVRSAKPDAGIYRSALDALGAEAAETLFVDDQAAYCEGARSLGMTAVLIDRRGATPGAVRSLDELMSAAGE